MAGSGPTSDCNRYKDENDDGEAEVNKAADDKVADNGAADDNIDQRESNNQNNDEDYMAEQRELGHSERGSSLDKARSPTLVTPEKLFWIHWGMSSPEQSLLTQIRNKDD